MSKIRKLLAMALAVVMSMSVAVPVFAAEATPGTVNQLADTATEDSSDDGIMPLGTDYYTVGNPGTDYVRIFERRTPYSGPITITVHNFNPILFQVDILAYNQYGLLFGEDNWMTGGSKAVYVPGTHGGPITALWLRIKPRAQLLTQDRAFTVEVNW